MADLEKPTLKKAALEVVIPSAIKVEHRFRGGHMFTDEPKTVLLSELTEKQVDAIKNDNLLKVKEVFVDVISDEEETEDDDTE